MHDSSVVTEAERPRALEFVTESAMQLKKAGASTDWMIVHRYEIEPRGIGCHVTYTSRVTRASALPGPLGVFKLPILRWLAMREAAGQAKRGLRNLSRMAEQLGKELGREGSPTEGGRHAEGGEGIGLGAFRG
jgi:hypothetical protein